MKNRPAINSILILAAIFALIQGCAFISLDLASFIQYQPFEERQLQPGGKDKVLVVEILGPITVTALRDTFRPSQGTLERLDAVLGKAVHDKNIRGIIIKIDSPGGGYTASDLVFKKIKTFKEKQHVPVVACITNQGTSGAYLIALAADKIVALPTSMVGNVGVILPSISLEGLLEKLGIRNQSITSGKFKDTGNILRDMTDEDTAILENIVTEFYTNFIGTVQEYRPVTEDDLKIISDGRIMTASRAKDLHLIDVIGYFEEALRQTEDLAGTSNSTVVVYRRKGENSGGFYSWP